MLTQRRNYVPLGAEKQAHRRAKVIKSQLRGRSTSEPRYRLIKRALGGSVVLLMWPGSAACHQPALSLLCFSFYQQLLRRHSAAVANESSDLLPAFSHPLSQPGSPFWLSLPPPHTLFPLYCSYISMASSSTFFLTFLFLPVFVFAAVLLRFATQPSDIPSCSLPPSFFFSISPQSSQGLSGKASDTCCNSRSLDKTATEETFRPQSEIVDNRRLHPAGQQSIFHRNTCAHEFV